MVLVMLLLAGGLSAGQDPPPAPPPLQQSFAGRWINAAGPVLTALEVEVKGATAVVHAWAKCEPSDCDWGTSEGDVYRVNVGTRGGPALAAVFTRDRVENRLIVHAAGNDRLAVEVLSRLEDDPSRNSTAFAILAREGAPLRLMPAEQRPVRVGGSIREPVKVKNVNPVYPNAAKQDRIQGLVILECTIGPDGSVVDTRVVRGAAPELDRAAIAAVRQWRYTPTLVDGVAVPVIMTVTVSFNLR
jgi:TonB family protein